MLVKRIKEFIKSLEGSKIPCDNLFRVQLAAHFSNKEDSSELTKEDILFIKEQFENRSLIVKGKAGDYTLYPSGVNLLWVALAKELANDIRESYVKVLFPEVVNTVDYHDLSALTETENPENFYFGTDSRILYRKRSLCDHLRKNNYSLSTIQNKRIKDTRPLRVDELTRLKLCQSTRKVTFNGIESGREEEFESFWDMLVKKSFPKLNPTNAPCLDILPYLLQVIEAYYVLKAARAPFPRFNSKVKDLLKFLYTHELNYVNQFYGTIIEGGDKKLYMLDCLIDLYKADGYTLDRELDVLTQWLHGISPRFKLTSSTPSAPIYSAATPSVQSLRPKMRPEDNVFYDLKLMLLSLFVVDLKGYSFFPTTISVWDQENSVHAHASAIYESFRPLLIREDTAETRRDLIIRYLAIKREKIDTHIPCKGVSGFFSCVFVGHIDDWFAHAKEQTFSDLNVFWYDPELIMYTLMHFHAANSEIQKQIWQFLDELIRTYCQDMPRLQKELRINILFSKLMEKIENTAEHKALRLLLDVYADQCDYQSEFMINCCYYIGNKLRQIDYKKDALFYTLPDTMKKLKAKIATSKITSMSDLMVKYREEITNDEEIRKEPERKKRLITALTDLQRYVITCEEKLAAAHTVPGIDTFSPT